MPNSILWIGLVVLWVFVLFPMLANRHPRIRRTTDAALATRVLYRGGSKRRRKNGPHDSDPDYRPTRRTRRLPQSDDAEDRMTTEAEEPVTDDEHTVTDPRDQEDRPAPTELDETEGESAADADDEYEDAADADAAADDEDAEPGTEDAEYDDEPYDDAGEDDGYDAPDADSATDEDVAPRVSARIPPAPAKAPARLDDDLYEDEDSGEMRSADEDDVQDAEAAEGADDDFVPTRRGRGGYDPEADAIARAARYTFRQRAVLGLLITGLLCGALGLVIGPVLWWGTGLSLVVLIGYLAYLRKQVRMEEEIRRRRAARLSRTRPHEDEAAEPAAPRRVRRASVGMDRDTARTLRRRSVLLEPDDEAPDFEQLSTFDPAAARALRNRTEDMRRAAGE